MKRREFLKNTAGIATAALVASTLPGRAAAALAPAVQDAEADLIASLFPGLSAERSDDVRIDAPYVTTRDQGFVVNVTAGDRPIEGIAIMVAAAPMPLAHAARLFRPGGSFSARMKLARTADVNVYVQSGGRLLKNRLHIKVTHGGYGTNG